MASKAGSKVVSEVVSKATSITPSSSSSFLSRLTPWRITGPVSDPEWKDVPVSAEEFRPKAPASFTTNSLNVPNVDVDADRVFNVKYYDRDKRRAFEPYLHGEGCGRTERKITKETDFDAFFEKKNKDDARTLYAGKRHPTMEFRYQSSEYRQVNLLEQAGGGYTEGK